MRLTLEELEREFGRIEVRARDLRPVMRAGGLMGLSEVRTRFHTQTDPSGVPWAPLAHARPEGGTLPLRNHGTLAASFTSESGPDFFRVGTNLPHARLLHFGGVVTPKNKRFLTLPLTREAVYAGSARNQTGLHFQGNARAGVLADAAGVAHWALVKRVTVPPRRIVGLSALTFRRWAGLLVHYLRSGRMT